MPSDPAAPRRHASICGASRGTLESLGPYRIERVLGKGGMGLVYEATDTRLGRRVALKVIRSGEGASPEELIRFRAEARSAGRLKHPNIVPIYDVGRADDIDYFVMEYVEGYSLDVWLRRPDRTFRERATLVEKIARAIQHAHENGIIHRDLKPANVMVDERDEPHVMDFGLARTVDSQSGLTVSGQAMGTPSYMPPEQAEGRASAISPRSDVWSLGAILYEALTGRPPFTGETILLVLNAVTSDDPVTPRSLDRSVPRDLETIALKCLEKDPRRRYASAGDLADDIRRFLGGEPITARPASVLYRVRKRVARHRAVAAVTAASLAALAALGTWSFIRIARERDEALRQQAAAESERDRALKAERGERQQRRAAEAARDEARAALERAERENYHDTIARAEAAWRSGEPATLRSLLNEAPARFRHWEWGRLNRLTHLEQRAFRGHGGLVASVAARSDGTRIVSGNKDGSILLWDAATGRQLQALRGHQGTVMSVALDARGERIVSGSWDHTVRLWDAAAGNEIRALRGHDHHVTSVAFSPDGRNVASASYDGTARIWDAATGEVLFVLSGHEGWVWSVAFSPDGARVVTGGRDGTVRVWDAKNGTLVTSIATGKWVMCATFSPDGNAIARGGQGTLQLLDPTTGSEIGSFTGHEDAVASVSFSADGTRLVTASWDKTVRVWDVATRRCITTLRGHEGTVSGAAFLADTGSVVSGSHDGSVRMWAVGIDPSVRIFARHDKGVRALAFFPDGSKVVTSDAGGTVRVWEAASGREIHVLRGHRGNVGSVAVRCDGSYIASAGQDAMVSIWDAESGNEMLRVGQATARYGIAISPDGAWLASVGDDAIARVLDLRAGVQTHVLRGHDGSVLSVAVGPRGRYVATGGRDATVRIWRVETEQEALLLAGHAAPVVSIAFSPDGRYLASASWDTTVRIWSVETGTLVCPPRSHEVPATAVAFGPDGRRIVEGVHDGTVRIVDAATGREAMTLRGHKTGVTAVAFSPDGTCVASASWDQTVRLWYADQWWQPGDEPERPEPVEIEIGTTPINAESSDEQF